MRKAKLIQIILLSTMIGSLCVWAQLAATEEKEKAPAIETEESKPVYRLIDCINIALQKNPNVLAALKRIEEAEGKRIEARAGLLPSLTTGGTALYREQDYATQNGANPNLSNEDWNINVRLTQSIYSGGAVRNRFAISKLEKEQRNLEYREAVDEMMMNVRIAFYEVLENQVEIEVRKQAVEMLQEELKDQKSRYEAGTVPRLNVLRAEVNLANEMPALIEAQNNYKNIMLTLSELMAIPYSAQEGELPFSIRGSLEYHQADFSLEDCLAKAEALRPELKTKELEIQIQEKQITVDRSNILPQVGLFAGYDLLNQTDKSSLHDTIGGYVAGIAGTWRVFDGLETTGKLKATRARLASAYLDRDATRNAIFTEVRSAFLKLEQAEATVSSQTENSTLARESFMLSKASFEAGLSTQLDIMQSRVDLTKAQTNELKAKFDHKVALAKLQRAISSEFKIIDDHSTQDLSKEQFIEPLPIITKKPEPSTPSTKEEKRKESSSLFKAPQQLPRRANDSTEPPPFVIPRSPSPKPRHLSYHFLKPSLRRGHGEMPDIPQIIVNPNLAMLRQEE